MNFADFALRHDLSVLVPQFDKHADHGTSDRSHLSGLVLRWKVGNQTDFRAAIKFVEACMRESLKDGLLGMSLQRRPATDDNA